jgi:hypothetical protein
MLKAIRRGMQEFFLNSRVTGIRWYQKQINDLDESNHLGIMFRRKWGRMRVMIAYKSNFVENVFEYDLNSAYWYITGVADGIGIGVNGKIERS